MRDIPSFWHKRTVISWLLWPLSVIMLGVVLIRKQLYVLDIKKSYQTPVPLIVIGNLTVGGNGKTPVVMALCNALSEHGLKVGVVSRGYGGNATETEEVLVSSDATVTGDEALLIKQQCQVPVFIDKKRAKAVQTLIKQYPQTQVIISDDGLQHYAMGRNLEWVVIARDMGLGNRFLLPAGPLREPANRLNSVGDILLHGEGDFKLPNNINTQKLHTLTQTNKGFRLLGQSANDYQPISTFTTYNQFYGITAIARAERFFDTLSNLSVELIHKKALPDHDAIAVNEIDCPPACYVIITEKDAVKTADWPMALKERTLVLAHELTLPPSLIDATVDHIHQYSLHKELHKESAEPTIDNHRKTL